MKLAEVPIDNYSFNALDGGMHPSGLFGTFYPASRI